MGLGFNVTETCFTNAKYIQEDIYCKGVNTLMYYVEPLPSPYTLGLVFHKATTSKNHKFQNLMNIS